MSAGRTAALGIFKRGWNEIPELMGVGAMSLIGLGLFGISYYMYINKNGDNRKHKLYYTVIRHDDPKAATARTGING